MVCMHLGIMWAVDFVDLTLVCCNSFSLLIRMLPAWLRRKAYNFLWWRLHTLHEFVSWYPWRYGEKFLFTSIQGKTSETSLASESAYDSVVLKIDGQYFNAPMQYSELDAPWGLWRLLWILRWVPETASWRYLWMGSSASYRSLEEQFLPPSFLAEKHKFLP